MTKYDMESEIIALQEKVNEQQEILEILKKGFNGSIKTLYNERFIFIVKDIEDINKVKEWLKNDK